MLPWILHVPQKFINLIHAAVFPTLADVKFLFNILDGSCSLIPHPNTTKALVVNVPITKTRVLKVSRATIYIPTCR